MKVSKKIKIKVNIMKMFKKLNFYKIKYFENIYKFKILRGEYI
jgi:hypothetical protein